MSGVDEFDVEAHRPMLADYLSRGHFRPRGELALITDTEFEFIARPDLNQTLRICELLDHMVLDPDIEPALAKSPRRTPLFGVRPLVFMDSQTGRANIISKPELVAACAYMGYEGFYPQGHTASKALSGGGVEPELDRPGLNRFSGVSIRSKIDGREIVADGVVHPRWPEFVEEKLFFTESYIDYAIAKAEQGVFYGEVGVLMCLAAASGLARTPFVASDGTTIDEEATYKLSGVWPSVGGLEDAVYGHFKNVCASARGEVGARGAGGGQLSESMEGVRRDVERIVTMFEGLAELVDRVPVERGEPGFAFTPERIQEHNMLQKMWSHFVELMPDELGEVLINRAEAGCAAHNAVVASARLQVRVGAGQAQAGQVDPPSARAKAVGM